MDRIERLRALKNGLPSDIGAGASSLRRKVEAEREGRHADLNQQQQQEVFRLLAMIETAFLAAAADGEFTESEIVNLGGNLSSWIGQELDGEVVATLLEGMATALAEQGLEGRLAQISTVLDPQSARTAYALASAVVVCDLEVRDEELGVLGDIAEGLGIPEDEAQATFNSIYEGLEAALAQG